jgi:hypothetical protein
LRKPSRPAPASESPVHESWRALVAEPFDGELHRFLIDLEAEVNLCALDVFFRQMLTTVSPVKSTPANAPGKL